jgi:hypothetical protein
MDSQATRKLDKPMQDIDQMSTYMSKLRNTIDKNNITIADYNSDQLTKQEFYKEFKLQAEGRQALTSDTPIPITEKEFEALRDKIAGHKSIKDDRFDWDGNYFTLDDGRIIRAYNDPHSNNSLSRPSYEFVSHIPEEREVMKEYAQEDAKKVVIDGTVGAYNYVFGDLHTIADSDASLGEYTMASLFTVGKPLKAGKDIGKFTISSFSEYIDDLAKGKGLPDAKPQKVEINKGTVTGTTRVKYGDQYTKVGRKKVLKPNVEYTSKEGYNYKTDAHGRINIAEGTLKLGDGKRNNYAQKIAGREDRKIDDEGGHLIASVFKGSGNLDNLVPMNGNLNKGEWKKLENTWTEALKYGDEVKVKITPNYRANSQRPESFNIKYKIGDDDWEIRRFDNVPGGRQLDE